MLKNGKKVTYVDSNNYVEKTEEKNLNADSVVSQMPDKIRYFSKMYWTLKNNKLVKEDNENALFDIEFFNNDLLVLRARKNKFLNIFFENGLLKQGFNKQKWEEFLLATIPESNQLFEDFYYVFQEPINLSEATDPVEVGANYIKKEYYYNFFSQNFENLVNSQTFDVKTIPSVFTILNDTQSEIRTPEENLLLSLGGLIPTNLVDSFQSANKINKNVQSYFDVFAKEYNKPEALPVISEIKNQQLDNVIRKEKIALTKNIKNNFIPFPFYIFTEFSNPSPHKEDFINILDLNFKLQNDLLEVITEKENILTKSFIYSNNFSEERELNFFDFKQIINNNLSIINQASDDFIEMPKIVAYTNLIEYVKNNLKTKTRKINNFMDKSCHNEVLFFKIEKRQFNYNSTPIQTYYVVPSSESIIKFFDTQVKYGTDYYYTINAYSLVIGTKYFYEEFKYQNDLDKQKDLEFGIFKLNIKQSADYKIFEVPFAKFTTAIHEFPYTKPIVQIQQHNNNLLFTLLQSETDGYEEFKLLENNDLKVFESIRKAQENEKEEKIRSKINSDQETNLEIYRITKIPTNYISFQGKLYKNIKLQKNQKSFIDNIIKNVKYYYLFRYINKHGVPSNVSDVIEVEKVEDNGTTSIRTKKIDLEKSIPRKETKDFKRYVLIKPSLIQTQFSGDLNTTDVDSVQLGPVSDKVWNKEFILRIKSKKTNRILEFNLSSIINKKK